MMITKVPQRQLSPLGKNLNLIGKLIAKQTQNPQNDELINKNESVGINTSKITKWVDEQDIVKPVTHKKMSSSFYKGRSTHFSNELSNNQSKRINLMNISMKNERNKRSPVGTIFKQEGVNRSMPISPENYEIQKNRLREGQQLPNIETSTKNLRQGNKKSFSERFTKMEKRINIGKTYTPSILNRKSNIFREDIKKSVKKDIQTQNSGVKFPIFNTKEYQDIENKELKKSKQFQQQTDQVHCSPLKQQKFQQASTMFNGYIYNRNHPQTKFTVSMNTPIKKIKQLLIEGQEKLNITFQIPQILHKPPSHDSTPEKLHYLMLQAFNSVGVIPQIICIKKYSNCVVMRDKKLCILWNFNGKVYFGEWDKNNTQSEGNKQGIGFQWSPQNYIYYGQFRQNRREGYGIMRKQNKQMYIGCWKDNTKNGSGKIYNESGQLVQNGEYKDGSLFLKRQ